jgi:hypothetical protein
MAGGVAGDITSVHAERFATQTHIEGHRDMVNSADVRRVLLRNLEPSSWRVHASFGRRDRRGHQDMVTIYQPGRLVPDTHDDTNFGPRRPQKADCYQSRQEKFIHKKTFRSVKTSGTASIEGSSRPRHAPWPGDDFQRVTLHVTQKIDRIAFHCTIILIITVFTVFSISIPSGHPKFREIGCLGLQQRSVADEKFAPTKFGQRPDAKRDCPDPSVLIPSQHA